MNSNRFILELLILISITPIFVENLHPAVPLVVFVLWLFVSSQQKGFSFVLNDPWGVSKWWFILLGWQLALSVIGYSTTSPNNYITRLPLYGIPIAATYIIRTYSHKEQRKLFSFIVIVMLLNVFQNYMLALRDPGFFDTFQHGAEGMEMTNGGTTGFVQACLFAIPCCFMVWSRRLRIPQQKLALWGMVAFIIYIMFVNTRATSFLILLFFVFALLYMRYIGSKIKNKMVGYALVVFLIVGAIAVSIPMLDWIATNTSSEGLSVRLNTVTESMATGEIDENSEGSLGSRYLLGLTSFETWTKSIKNFIFGIGDDVAADGHLMDLISVGIGRHSQILDFLAMFGIVGAFFLYKAWKSIFRCIKSQSSDKSTTLLIDIVIMGYIIMNVLNNTLVAGQNIIMFLLLPLSVMMISNRQYIINNTSVSKVKRNNNLNESGTI